eukprot:CAMPEP_0175840736 /NCGR_PEP_ID=MMETSP0107_2-20121207/19535_1 /TAXON_ID=195067 ORGANISM="Goniomonas pacifica, Strain CCMP1869" /NCGR_SAMPLE_ID=MMETSP0107_2 /ASSEMBLY_ACC=CAM_ASM_000203 /LENGTH=177 /DNA_ID=CAMNT_0017154617 /DNA_START=455 /DNA_END=988 /DNA_ORIENTATION=-
MRVCVDSPRRCPSTLSPVPPAGSTVPWSSPPRHPPTPPSEAETTTPLFQLYQVKQKPRHLYGVSWGEETTVGVGIVRSLRRRLLHEYVVLGAVVLLTPSQLLAHDTKPLRCFSNTVVVQVKGHARHHHQVSEVGSWLGPLHDRAAQERRIFDPLLNLVEEEHGVLGVSFVLGGRSVL